MSNPYEALEKKAFWKPSVADRHMLDIAGLWDPRFDIKPHHKVATFGSCFAQHIGKALRARGFDWFITETAPHGMSPAHCLDFNYGVFSARTGNIYTTSLLRQWTEWASGVVDVPEEVWHRGDRLIDPFRPRIEPDGFGSLAELRASQAQTIKSFRRSIAEADFFVFTLGLTESWRNKSMGFEYPMCPGTVGGEFDPTEHVFENQTFDVVRKNLVAAIEMMRTLNPKLRFILTVSPVPLTATMTKQHVLVATMYSKSVLRAVAGQLCTNHRDIDYFPSYEIINSPVFRGSFFEPNQRSVNHHGVDHVMDTFFACLSDKFGPAPVKSPPTPAVAIGPGAVPQKTSAEVCEEELLGAFGPK